MKQGLSVCCLTCDPAPQVARALERVRPYAQEIVIAVDSRVPTEELAGWSGVADRLLRVELGDWVEQAWTWLHRQCTGDWILRLDGDEVCGAAFLAQLPELLAARDVVQYWLPRRWVFPDPGHWLDEWPWAPDFQNRLYRNDALLWFSGRLHTSAEPVFPRRFLEQGIYHLEPLLKDRATRQAKTERYVAHRELCGSPLDAETERRFYLPEDHMQLTPQPVPPADLEAIRRVMAAPAAAAAALAPALPQVPLARAEEVLGLWAGRQLRETDYRAHIGPVDTYRWLRSGDQRQLRVLVENRGGAQWPGGSERRPLITLGSRWLHPDGTPIDAQVPRVPLPEPLAPGQSCIVRAGVFAPEQPGSYLLEFELVHEHVRWFGRPSDRIEMTVQAAGDIKL